MNVHSITTVSTPHAPYPGAYPTFHEFAFDIGEGRDELLGHRQEKSPVLPTRPRRESAPSDSETVGFPSIAAAPHREGDDPGQAQSANPGRDDALKRLAELEAFAKLLGDPAMRDVAVRSCRDAVTLLSFWPSDLIAPNADIDYDGTVSVEQFRADGTLQAIFEFSEPNRAAYAVLTGTTVVKKGYVSTLDPGEMTRAFERIRSVADETADAQAVVDLARQHELEAVANELQALFELPRDDEEESLHADASLNFVRYCIARAKTGCPLITVTPTGNLDITWKGGVGERVIMRFFGNGTVWVALKLKKIRGSLELAARDLAEQSHKWNLPEWA